MSRLQSRLLLPVPWRVRERTWERGCYLKYSIHGKELGSILLCHWKKKYPDLASTRFQIHSVFKNFHSGVRIKKIADSSAGFSGYVWTERVSAKKKLRIQKYRDTCGRGLRHRSHESGYLWKYIFFTRIVLPSTRNQWIRSAEWFLSLVYTDSDLKMCGFKTDFKINRRSMYEKMHSLKKTDDIV